MSEPQPDEKPCITKNFDTALKGLLRAMTDVYEQTAEKGTMGIVKTQTQPYWVVCTEKFHSLYLKVNKPESFIPMFKKFFDTYKKDIIDVIIEDGRVYDEWIKVKDVLPSPKNPEPASSDKKKRRTGKVSHMDGTISWSANATCSGIVLYYGEDPKFRAINIPISEAYIEACKHYDKSFKEKKEHSPLPATILLCLYACAYHVASKEDAELIQENLISLKEVVDSLVPEDNGEGNTLNPIKEIMKTFAKQTGMASALGGMGDGKMNEAFNTLFNPETTEKIGNVIKAVNEQMKDTKTDNIGDVLTKVGSVLTSPDIKQQISDTVDGIQKLQATIPTAENTPVANATGNSTQGNGSSEVKITGPPNTENTPDTVVSGGDPTEQE